MLLLRYLLQLLALGDSFWTEHSHSGSLHLASEALHAAAAVGFPMHSSCVVEQLSVFGWVVVKSTRPAGPPVVDWYSPKCSC